MSERPHEYLSLERAAAQYDMSIRTVRRMISRGELTGYRVGKRLIRVEAGELEQMLRPIPAAGKIA